MNRTVIRLRTLSERKKFIMLEGEKWQNLKTSKANKSFVNCWFFSLSFLNIYGNDKRLRS
jgi:hypothetical protein